MARKRGEYQKHQELVMVNVNTVGNLAHHLWWIVFCCNLLQLPIKTEKVTTKENEMLINYWETLCLNYTKNHY